MALLKEVGELYFASWYLDRGNENFGDQLVLGRRSRIVYVVFDAEVVAHLHFCVGDNLKNAGTSFRQIGVGTSQNKTAVFPTLELCVFHALRQIVRRGLERNTSAIYLWLDFIKAHVSGDFVVL